jgi:hypothetical protein
MSAPCSVSSLLFFSRAAVRRAALLAAGLLLALAPTVLAQDGVLGTPGTPDVFPAKPAITPLTTEHGIQLVGPPSAIILDAVINQTFILEDQADPPPCKALRYAVGRDVPQIPGVGTWLTVDPANGGGRIWVCDITSPTAYGLRLHLADMNLPQGARVVIFDPANPNGFVDGPYEGRGVHDSGEMWSLTIFSQTARVEVYLPPKAVGGPGLVIDRLQHAYRSFDQVFSVREGGCYNDVSCFANWASNAKATAGIGIISNNSLYCTGTMLNDLTSDLTPYFLTANHCLSSSSTAQNSEIYWLFQTSSCNGAPPALTSVSQSNVCTLLSTNATSDYTFLMVEGTIPRASLFWAGWTPTVVPDGTLLASIHHPAGTYKRISFGTKASNVTCGNSSHIRSDWYAVGGILSVTEPGSSGSGLFRQDSQQLVGQLHCGPSACGNAASAQHDDYGAFSVTYAGISGFLAGGTDDSLEPNDSCAAARTITPGTRSGLIVKSTSEDWYKVSVPGSGGVLTVTAAFTHAYGDIDMQVFATCGGTALVTSSGTTNTESITYTNTGATAIFYIHVYPYSDSRNSYSLSVTAVPPVPANDACANAITVGAGVHSGTTIGAVNDGPTTCLTHSTASPDVWYAYTAPCNGTLKIDTCGSAFDTAVSIHTGCPGTAGNQIACNDDCATAGFSCVSTNQSCLTLAASSGTTYYIRVGGFNGVSGVYTLNIVLDAGLPNNACASAIAITGGTYSGTTCGATPDGAASCGISNGTSDVWYAYTPTCTGILSLDSCGSSFDTVLSVHTACPGAAANEIACNDDCAGGNCAGGLPSCLSVSVTAGTTYYIRVSGFLGEVGNFVLHVGLAPPTNDSCSTATQIIPGGIYTGTTCGATVDGSAACGLSASTSDVWYSFTPSFTGLARLDTCTSGYDTVVSVHTSCPGILANQAGCNDDAPAFTTCASTLQSVLNVPVSAGVTYYIRIAGYYSSVGSYTLHYSLGPIANETCLTAIPVHFGTYTFTTTGATTDGPSEANCAFCCNDLQVNQDIWYSIVAPCQRQITIDTIGSSYDTKLAVYLSCPTSNDAALACNDDFGGLGTSSVTFTPTTGTLYTIRVGGYAANAGAGTLHIRSCLPDFNCNGILEVQDIFDYINAWFATNPRADFNYSGGIEVQDIFDFLNAWFAGCH